MNQGAWVKKYLWLGYHLYLSAKNSIFNSILWFCSALAVFIAGQRIKRKY